MPLLPPEPVPVLVKVPLSGEKVWTFCPSALLNEARMLPVVNVDDSVLANVSVNVQVNVLPCEIDPNPGSVSVWKQTLFEAPPLH